MIKVFGIRHHGSGSSRSLEEALEQFQPDMILIESPADTEPVLPYAADPAIKLPVAILVYNPKDLEQASYLPYAAFSPEWVTMQFGFKNDIPMRFMDLPLGYLFQEQETRQAEIFGFQKEKKEADFYRDPLGEMASLAGYTDSERWWEATFEQQFNPIEIFEQIEAMITALRSVKPDQRTETLRREAFMRITLRQAIKDGFEKIAVICGAWHVPAITQHKNYKATADKAFLRGLKKIKTKATWIPWSYERLAIESGYSAGVKSPAWYDLLFHHKKEASIHWMSKVSTLLRDEGMDMSAAHAVEAVRLAETLATIRNLQLPGILELKEAAMTVFGSGSIEALTWIERKLIIGEQYGEVPDTIPMIPLQKDLEKSIKSARLTKERNSIEKVEKKLDLRKKTNLDASRLLHRLNILDISWGTILAGAEKATGSFSEHWGLKWLPDFAIKIIEAGMWGNTVPEAASRKLFEKAKTTNELAVLTDQVAAGLLADLPLVIPFLIKRLREISTLTEDALHLMDSLPSLVRIMRYGNVRKTDTEQVRSVVEEFVPRLCIGLTTACVSLDEENSKGVFEKIIAANHSISILGNNALQQSWNMALQQMVVHPAIHPILKGACTRILFEKRLYDIKETATQMHYALSMANDATESATWLEGFLHGSGLLLIHNPSLWKILDEWVEDIGMNNFKEILPLLRRTFSQFPPTEREKMMQLAKHVFDGKEKNIEQGDNALQDIEALMPTIRLLLS